MPVEYEALRAWTQQPLIDFLSNRDLGDEGGLCNVIALAGTSWVLFVAFVLTKRYRQQGSRLLLRRRPVVQPIEISVVEDNPGDAKLTAEALRDARILNRFTP